MVHSSAPPRDEDWAFAIEQRWAPFGRAIRSRGETPLCLVWTPSGHGPNAKQRTILDKYGDLLPRVAVLSDSTLVRGIVTAVSWFGHTEIRAFSASGQSDHVHGGRMVIARTGILNAVTDLAALVAPETLDLAGREADARVHGAGSDVDDRLEIRYQRGNDDPFLNARSQAQPAFPGMSPAAELA